MSTDIRRLVVFLLAGACTREAESDEATGGVGVECVSPSSTVLSLELLPENPVGQSEWEYEGECTVQSVSAAPASFELLCDGASEFSLLAPGLAVPLPSTIAVGATLELRYARSSILGREPAWMVLRVAGESAPVLVAVSALDPVPWFLPADDWFFSVNLSSVETNCEDEPGSCNTGPSRRAAVEVAIQNGESTVVTDRNVGEVGDYLVHVGEAVFDMGNCDGMSSTWFEVVLVRP